MFIKTCVLVSLHCIFSLKADKEFIEQRRRALRRFLNLIVRHPVMKDDDIVKYFLTFPGTVTNNLLLPNTMLYSRSSYGYISDNNNYIILNLN